MRSLVILTLIILAACNAPLERSLQTDGAVISGDDAWAVGRYDSAIVSLWYPDTSDECTGTVISDHTVLTAAHCYSDEQPYICFSHRTARELSASKELEKYCLRADNSIKHDRYQDDFIADDVATEGLYDIRVVHFSQKLAADVKPIALADKNFPIKPGQDVTLAGFGKISMYPDTNTKTLQIADLQITQQYSKTEFLLAQFENRGACHGDSGGPVYVEKDGKKILLAIVSRGPTMTSGESCLEGFLATDIRKFRDWIDEASRKLIRAAN